MQEQIAEAQDQVTVGQALEMAVERHRSGRISEAQMIYERILQVQPDCAEALHFLGLIKFQTGDPQAAIADLNAAIEASPDYVAAHNNLGNVYSERKRYADAESCYRKVIELEPQFADAHSNLGIALKELGAEEKAEQALRRALELQPEHVEALNNLGILLKERGELDQAGTILDRALDLRPDHAEAMHNRGLVYSAQGRYADAEKLFKKALKLGADAYINLGKVLREQGRVEEAMEVYRKVVEGGERVGEGYYNLGMLLEAMGRNDEAAAVFGEWCDREPDNEVARHMFAACSGATAPERANDEYVRSVFDGFAPTFESRLKDLGYRAPELLAGEVDRLRGGRSRLEVLDAGCGTGLCGPLLQPFAGRMVGVDLSEGMLDLARKRDIYDELIAAELTAYLATTDARFDLVVSADTLVYFGDVAALLAGAWRVLHPGGLFSFTVEQGADEQEGYRLLPHGRYGHNEQYLRRLLVQTGFDPVELRPDVLRLEVGKPVSGLVVNAQKPV